jgi:hypothetical protein
MRNPTQTFWQKWVILPIYNVTQHWGRNGGEDGGLIRALFIPMGWEWELWGSIDMEIGGAGTIAVLDNNMI